jgi:hypothetical protein
MDSARFSPLAVGRIGERNSSRIAAVPGVFRQPGLLCGGMVVEEGKGGRLMSILCGFKYDSKTASAAME